MTLTFAEARVHHERSEVADGSSLDGASPLERRFEVCFATHYARVVAYALRRMPDLAAAEDVASETFLIAWRRFSDAPPDALPWLLAIARNVIFNQSRSDRRRQQLVVRVATDRTLADELPGASGTDDPAVRGATVRAAVARLGARDREILLLTSWDGLTSAQAAKALGCSRGTFAVRLHRARIRLARELDELTTSQSSTPGDES
jgi:RNA polymerase sigma factor (sigma-70 family)